MVMWWRPFKRPFETVARGTRQHHYQPQQRQHRVLVGSCLSRDGPTPQAAPRIPLHTQSIPNPRDNPIFSRLRVRNQKSHYLLFLIMQENATEQSR